MRPAELAVRCRTHLVAVAEPDGGVRVIEILGKPRAAVGVMDELCSVVHPVERVPGLGHLADLLVGNVLKAVQVCAGLHLDHVFAPQPQLAAVHEHHARPVFARVGGLHRAVHLDRVRGAVVVLDDAERVGRHVEIVELLDIAEAEHVVVEKQRLALKIAQVRRQEPSVGEFGRRQRVVLAFEMKLVELEVVNLERDRCVL
jgi:hypothetical protein